MIFLTAAVGAFILGITHRHRHTPQAVMTKEDKFRAEDTRRIMETPKNLGR
jgi:hypothetical protein